MVEYGALAENLPVHLFVGPDIALQLLQPPILVVLIHLLVHVLNKSEMIIQRLKC